MAPARHTTEELTGQHGLFTRRHKPVWRHWREPYVLALSLTWPAFLVVTAAVYLAINVLFAALYQLDPNGIGGTSGPQANGAEAFFFSVQTLGSIGFGVLHPKGLYANLLVTAESLCGLLFVAITTGLAFARFARSNARIRFSQSAVVFPYNGEPTLSFRLANERGNRICEARLKAFLAVDEISREGHRLRRLRPLALERDEGVAFSLIWTAMHRMDASSPLQGLTPEELGSLHAEVLVAFSGVDETIERPIHAHASWPAERIQFGACFADMMTFRHNEDRHQIDWSAFDRIRGCQPF